MLQGDGSVKAYRGVYDQSGSLPKELTNVLAIASGGAADLALTKDGRVFGWGVNDQGQATGVITTNYIASGYVTINGKVLTNVSSIAAGGNMNLALKQDGTLVAWGGLGMFGTAGKPTVSEGLSNVIAIAAGSDYCLAITTNSTVADHLRFK
jgi:alpha-tubulin suppressor-like RCC1 family protein